MGQLSKGFDIFQIFRIEKIQIFNLMPIVQSLSNYDYKNFNIYSFKTMSHYVKK